MEELAHALVIGVLFALAEAVEVALDLAPDSKQIGRRRGLGLEVLVELRSDSMLAMVEAR